ncbi:site-specific tyrosine recombinase XerC [Marinibactrum halimedae]|uniref:Tyrosine recombinase XerD n=1 Tax=Marinibactrum halimedae TaxID=1444977 RepID=A0AA37WM78_9GAMM|nr:site-specific tyrosine recombinase XerC [Marinibactrum halimedae]MCD9461165.1 site-specific tyrosine recombinase XerC [Marinibactrum halimedae]MCD9461171.1 site-specific tyrosine recombinase XerC [Marinibactrum halimedae]GLS24606.1 tyrosine recombinase XerD [Marinibactrum halimedae]
MLRKKHHSTASTQKLNVDHSGMAPYLAHYLEWNRVKGYSEETNKRKDSNLRRFILWCDERGLSHPGEVTKPILERYQRYLFYLRQDNGEPLSYASQNIYLSTVRSFFKWLTQENHIPSNPASEVMPVKRSKRLPQIVLSVDQVDTLLDSVDTQTPEGQRDRAILELFYSTGLRRLEMCRLQLQDLHLSRQTLLVRNGKGGKDRYVPIGKRAVHWVANYLHHIRPLYQLEINASHVFLTDYGEAFTSSNMGRMVKRYLDKAEIKAEGACHLLRHAMATHMLENGAELRYLQAILGHADINTTTIYTHVSMEHLHRVHENTHPAKL